MNVKQARIAAGYRTVRDAARTAGLSERYIRMAESANRGDRRIGYNTARKLAVLYRCRIESFI